MNFKEETVERKEMSPKLSSFLSWVNVRVQD